MSRSDRTFCMEKVTKKRKENQGSHYLYIALYSLFQPQNMIRKMFWIWSPSPAWHGMAWHGMAYVSYILCQLHRPGACHESVWATQSGRKSRCESRLREPCRNRAETSLETCWMHLDAGYMLDFVRARTDSGPMLPMPKIFLCTC